MLNDGHLYEKTENDILTVGELEDYRVNSSVVLCGGQANKVTIARDIVGLDFEHFKRIR
jgi:ABC-type methionine transport system ATPase subunit